MSETSKVTAAPTCAPDRGGAARYAITFATASIEGSAGSIVAPQCSASVNNVEEVYT